MFLCFKGERERPGVGLLLHSGVKWAVYRHDLLSPPEMGPVEKVPPGTTDT